LLNSGGEEGCPRQVGSRFCSTPREEKISPRLGILLNLCLGGGGGAISHKGGLLWNGCVPCKVRIPEGVWSELIWGRTASRLRRGKRASTVTKKNDRGRGLNRQGRCGASWVGANCVGKGAGTGRENKSEKKATIMTISS